MSPVRCHLIHFETSHLRLNASITLMNRSLSWGSPVSTVRGMVQPSVPFCAAGPSVPHWSCCYRWDGKAYAREGTGKEEQVSRCV